jgi:hypothetical protein
MDDSLTRVFGDLAGRLTGPLTFRLILQPLMAGFHAWRDGSRDARIGGRRTSGQCSATLRASAPDS